MATEYISSGGPERKILKPQKKRKGTAEIGFCQLRCQF